MSASALKVITAHYKLACIIRTVCYFQDSLFNHFIGILVLRAVTAPKLHSPIMAAQLVLMFAVYILVDYTTRFAHSTPYFRIVMHQW